MWLCKGQTVSASFCRFQTMNFKLLVCIDSRNASGSALNGVPLSRATIATTALQQMAIAIMLFRGWN